MNGWGVGGGESHRQQRILVKAGGPSWSRRDSRGRPGNAHPSQPVAQCPSRVSRTRPGPSGSARRASESVRVATPPAGALLRPFLPSPCVRARASTPRMRERRWQVVTNQVLVEKEKIVLREVLPSHAPRARASGG